MEGCLCVPLALGVLFLLMKSVSDFDILTITPKLIESAEGTLMKRQLVHNSQCCLLYMREPVWLDGFSLQRCFSLDQGRGLNAYAAVLEMIGLV